MPISAAWWKKNDDGSIPEVVFGSFRNTSPSELMKPSMRAYTLNCNALNNRQHSVRMVSRCASGTLIGVILRVIPGRYLLR